MGLGSGIRKKPIPDPGSGPGVKKAPDPGSGSATLIFIFHVSNNVPAYYPRTVCRADQTFVSKVDLY
jgi:hypothetical protein